MNIHDLIERLQEIERIHPHADVTVQVKFVDEAWANDDGSCEIDYGTIPQGISDIEMDADRAGNAIAVIIPHDGLY